MSQKPPVTAAEIRTALEVRYPGPEWHVEHELTLEGRRLDLVAFNRWGARSYRTVGFEIKVSQADYRRELEDFRKSELWTHVVDQFFIVAPGKLIDPETLPAGWGLLELRGERMYTKRQAAIGESKTLPRELAARMLDRMHKLLEAERRQASAVQHHERERLKQELRAQLAEEAARNGDTIRGKAARYDELLAEFGLAHGWRPDEQLVLAMRFLREERVPDLLEGLGGLIDHDIAELQRKRSAFKQARDLIAALRNPV